jgi:hypothetical protein
VDLGERGGADRLGGDPGEDGRQGEREILLDLAHDRREALGRHLVLKAGELSGDLGGEDVDPGREELAELDQHAAHLAGERAVAPGDLLVADEGRAAETAQPGDVEHHVPPDDLDEDAGDETAHLAVPPEIDPRGHGPYDTPRRIEPSPRPAMNRRATPQPESRLKPAPWVGAEFRAGFSRLFGSNVARALMLGRGGL